jgi:hypothetical protein
VRWNVRCYARHHRANRQYVVCPAWIANIWCIMLIAAYSTSWSWLQFIVSCRLHLFVALLRSDLTTSR